MSELTDIIQRIVAPLIPPPLVTGKVIAVDKDLMVCDVEIQSMPIRYDVRIRAVVDEFGTGFIVIPKIGSFVVVGVLHGSKQRSYVAMFFRY